jgi:hypothetical protein
VKAVLEVNTTELAKLVSSGLLNEATVLHRVDRQRRLLSACLTRATELQLREVGMFFAEHGHFDVPRTGRHAALGKWLSKLKESYAEGRDLERVRLVNELLPSLHVYLSQWAALRNARRPVHAPAWLQGAWAMEFMAATGRAASQASFDPAEVASAKWVTRWAKVREKFAGRETLDQRIGIAVYELSQRSRSYLTREAALQEARTWKASTVYDLIAEAAKSQPTLLHVDLDRLIAHRLAFWPTRSAWAAEHGTWQEESESAVRELASRTRNARG